MGLKDVQDVDINIDLVCLFIVAEVTDKNGVSKLVIRADAGCAHHRNILYKLQTKIGAELKARCIGGGTLCFDAECKAMLILGDSGEYGQEPDRQLTVAILKKAFPEFEITARN